LTDDRRTRLPIDLIAVPLDSDAATRSKQGNDVGISAVFNRTPNNIDLRWLANLLGVYKELGWGYAMWHFRIPLGLWNMDARVQYELISGYTMDSALVDLMVANRVAA
jgi:endoglucanase